MKDEITQLADDLLEKVKRGDESAFSALEDLERKMGMVNNPHPAVLRNLGECCEYGYGDNETEFAAFTYYREAAELGCDISMCKVGLFYRYGEGVSRNVSEAVRWFFESAEKKTDNEGGSLRAQKELQTWVSELEELVEREPEKRKALNNLGVCYQYGYPDEENSEKALALYHRAVALGSDTAMCNLGLAYQNGYGVDKDIKTAASWFYKSAQENTDQRNGSLRAFQALKELSRMSPPDNNILLNLAWCYHYGYGCKKNLDEALKLRHHAAELGSHAAMYQLGLTYRDGKGVDIDISKAADWFYRVGKEGGRELARNFLERLQEKHRRNKTVLTHLASCYKHGYGGTQNLATAVDLYHGAADLGCDVAMCQLGLVYRDGLLDDISLIRAANWFLKSAEQKNQEALHYLDELLERDIESNFLMYQIGLAYRYGKTGLPVDVEKAINWFLKATQRPRDDDSGSEKARQCLKELEALVTERFSESAVGFADIYWKLNKYDHEISDNLLSKITLFGKDQIFKSQFITELKNIYSDGSRDENEKASIAKRLIQYICRTKLWRGSYASALIHDQDDLTYISFVSLMDTWISDPYLDEDDFRSIEVVIKEIQESIKKSKTLNNADGIKRCCSSILNMMSILRLHQYFQRAEVLADNHGFIEQFVDFFNKITPSGKASHIQLDTSIKSYKRYIELTKNLEGLSQDEFKDVLKQYRGFLTKEMKNEILTPSQRVMGNILLLVYDPQDSDCLEALRKDLTLGFSEKEPVWKYLIKRLGDIFPTFPYKELDIDNINEKIKRYRESADSGNSNAMYELGCAYRYGEVVVKDLKIAIRWFIKAVKQDGNQEAKDALRDCCRYLKIFSDSVDGFAEIYRELYNIDPTLSAKLLETTQFSDELSDKLAFISELKKVYIDGSTSENEKSSIANTVTRFLSTHLMGYYKNDSNVQVVINYQSDFIPAPVSRDEGRYLINAEWLSLVHILMLDPYLSKDSLELIKPVIVGGVRQTKKEGRESKEEFQECNSISTIISIRQLYNFFEGKPIDDAFSDHFVDFARKLSPCAPDLRFQVKGPSTKFDREYIKLSKSLKVLPEEVCKTIVGKMLQKESLSQSETLINNILLLVCDHDDTDSFNVLIKELTPERLKEEPIWRKIIKNLVVSFPIFRKLAMRASITMGYFSDGENYFLSTHRVRKDGKVMDISEVNESIREYVDTKIFKL